MNIQLTAQQQQALDAERGARPRVIDPRTNAIYVLVPEADFETVQEILEEERCQQTIHEVALRNAVGRMNDVT